MKVKFAEIYESKRYSVFFDGGLIFMSFRMDDSELSKLFADVGAAVNKKKKVHTSESDIPAQQAEIPAKPVARVTPSVPESNEPEQIAGGTLDPSGMNLTLKNGSNVAFIFSGVRGLAAGRVGSEQILGWKFGKRIFFAVYRDINLKGMIPKMSASISENWKLFVNMMIEKCPPSTDQGLVISKKAVGVLPNYDNRELFFEHINSL